MKTKRLLALFVLALVVATCLYLVGCGECKHPELETTVVSNPTCTTDGVTNYSCSSCGYNETKTTPKLSQTGHNYVDGICTACNSLAPSTRGLKFTLNDDGNSYTCTSIGSCTSRQIFIGSYNNKPVTAIGDEAFKNCSNLTSVTIGNGVTSIGELAFYQCYNLTSIVIPDSVTSIGDYAFRYCNNLTNVTIGNSVTSIGELAFNNCFNLTSIKVATDNPNYCSQDGNLYNKDKTTLIQYACGKEDTTFTIPDSVTTIGDYAFALCSNLTSIVIPNSVTSIGEGAFGHCTSLTSVTLGNSVTSIGDYAFYLCSSLTSIVIPDSVTTIGDFVFCYCSNLTSVTLGNSVTTIGKLAFSECNNLTSIVIPDSVTTIDDRAFYDCFNMTIYCKATEKPDGWNSDWTYSKWPVYWAGQWHYDDNGNPTPNN